MVKYETIAKRLRELRKERGMSTEELGRMVKRSGKTIEAYETGTSQPNGDMLIDLCLALGCSISDLFPRVVNESRYDYHAIDIDELVPRERDLIIAFRMLRESDKAALMTIARSLAGDRS